MEMTEIKLLEALERIKSSNPIHISKTKKLSFSAVEDEALVSRSLSRHYPNVFEKIKKEIELVKANKIVSLNSENPGSAISLKDENKFLKEQIKQLKKEKNDLITANVALADRIRFLNNRK